MNEIKEIEIEGNIFFYRIENGSYDGLNKSEKDVLILITKDHLNKRKTD